MRVILSYGHDVYASLALRIKRDLEHLGHEVWFDLERLKPGGDWERYIEDGFDFASKDVDSGRFLLLMSPHSVRRPDGYCLNELSRAFSRNLPIVPVMVSTVEPPLSICRLQWLDMRECVPAEKHLDLYEKHFGDLVKALVEKQVPSQGIQQRLLNYLQPMTYADDLAIHLPRFTGREWVMKELEGWLASDSRILWIIGEPGVGKSALAAWMCDKNLEIAAYHFCRFGNADRTDARKALFSLAYQLSTQLPVYQERLNASSLDRAVAETNLSAVFDRLFVNPLAEAVPITDRLHVLLIDALDEATRNGRNDLASLIGNELHRLPRWMRFIVTSRPHEEEINFSLQALDPWKLEAGRQENRDDIRRYLRSELQNLIINAESLDRTVDLMLEKSEGLFLYARWVCKEVKSGRLSLRQVERFPQGLGGVYADFFRRYFPDTHEYASDCRPALEAVCAAREPLERRDLALLLGKTEYDMRLLATRLGSLFPAADGRIRPFHQSIRDWLTSPTSSGPYWIDVSKQEERLAGLAWQQFKQGPKSMGRYSVKHAPYHLAACRKKAEIKELLLDPGWIESKLQTAGVAPLINDYDLALQMFNSNPGVEERSLTTFSIGIPPWRKAMSGGAEWPISDERETADLRLIRDTIRLSSNAIGGDPEQLASQLTGRLLPYLKDEAVRVFLEQVAKNKTIPWLRPLYQALHPPGTSLLRTLRGHSEAVTDVAVTPDGLTAVSVSTDGTLKIWDLDTGHLKQTLESSHMGYVRVTLTPDGRQAVSVSKDDELTLWDLNTGRSICFAKAPRVRDGIIAVAADGRQAVSVSQHGDELVVWDLKAGVALSTLKGHRYSVQALAITPNSLQAVSAASDKTIKVWDLNMGICLRTLAAHSDAVTDVAVTPDGQRLVSASDDKILIVWDLETGVALHTLTGHFDKVTAVAVTPDGQRAVSASYDKTVRVWELETGRPLGTLQGHSGALSDLVVTPDGKRVVSASWDGTLKVWDISRFLMDAVTARAPHMSVGHTDKVSALAVSSGDGQAISASWDSTLKVWDISRFIGDNVRDTKKSRVVRTLRGHNYNSQVNGVAVTSDGRRAVSSATDKTLRVWNLKTGRTQWILEDDRFYLGVPQGLAVTPDDRQVISGYRSTNYYSDSTLKLYSIGPSVRFSLKWFLLRFLRWPPRRQPLLTINKHDNAVKSVAVTPDGRRAVSASYDSTLKVLDLQTGDVLRTLKGHSKSVNGVAVTMDGRQAVSASDDRTLKLWDLETGDTIRTMEGHSRSVNGVAITRDSRLVVSASEDTTLKLWRLDTGSLIATFTCDTPVVCCVFADDRLIVAGDEGGRVHFLLFE